MLKAALKIWHFHTASNSKKVIRIAWEGGIFLHKKKKNQNKIKGRDTLPRPKIIKYGNKTKLKNYKNPSEASSFQFDWAPYGCFICQTYSAIS